MILELSAEGGGGVGVGGGGGGVKAQLTKKFWHFYMYFSPT